MENKRFMKTKKIVNVTITNQNLHCLFDHKGIVHFGFIKLRRTMNCYWTWWQGYTTLFVKSASNFDSFIMSLVERMMHQPINPFRPKDKSWSYTILFIRQIWHHVTFGMAFLIFRGIWPGDRRAFQKTISRKVLNSASFWRGQWYQLVNM